MFSDSLNFMDFESLVIKWIHSIRIVRNTTREIFCQSFSNFAESDASKGSAFSPIILI